MVIGENTQFIQKLNQNFKVHNLGNLKHFLNTKIDIDEQHMKLSQSKLYQKHPQKIQYGKFQTNSNINYSNKNQRITSL